MTNEEMKAIEAKGMRRLQKYVEQQCKDDEHLRDRYNPDLMDRCWEWIREQVSNTARNGVAAVWHDNIYKLARDYFNDEIYKKSKDDSRKKAPVEKETRPVQKANPEPKPKKENKTEPEPKPEELQLDFFGGL